MEKNSKKTVSNSGHKPRKTATHIIVHWNPDDFYNQHRFCKNHSTYRIDTAIFLQKISNQVSSLVCKKTVQSRILDINQHRTLSFIATYMTSIFLKPFKLSNSYYHILIEKFKPNILFSMWKKRPVSDSRHKPDKRDMCVIYFKPYDLTFSILIMCYITNKNYNTNNSYII